MCENNLTESLIKTLTKLQLEMTVGLVQQTTTLGPALRKVAPHTEIELQSIMNASMQCVHPTLMGKQSTPSLMCRPSCGRCSMSPANPPWVIIVIRPDFGQLVIVMVIVVVFQGIHRCKLDSTLHLCHGSVSLSLWILYLCHNPSLFLNRLIFPILLICQDLGIFLPWTCLSLSLCFHMQRSQNVRIGHAHNYRLVHVDQECLGLGGRASIRPSPLLEYLDVLGSCSFTRRQF